MSLLSIGSVGGGAPAPTTAMTSGNNSRAPITRRLQTGQIISLSPHDDRELKRGNWRRIMMFSHAYDPLN